VAKVQNRSPTTTARQIRILAADRIITFILHETIFTYPQLLLYVTHNRCATTRAQGLWDKMSKINKLHPMGWLRLVTPCSHECYPPNAGNKAEAPNKKIAPTTTL
jgi:hypothetical protein